MLNCQMSEATGEANSSNANRLVVLLHGFLGSSLDWDSTMAYWEGTSTLRIDLPGHGLSKHCEVADFEETCQKIQTTIVRKLEQTHRDSNTQIIFVGYSLGARITMYGITHDLFAELNVQAALFEGGNFGLESQEQKELRWEMDKYWAKKFATQAIEDVLEAWYLQPVFASLTTAQRKQLIRHRSENLGVQLSAMLLACSLAKQPFLLPQLQQHSIPLLYLCGERDDKFKTLAEQSGLNYQVVSDAGHNVHIEQPQTFVQHLIQFIDSIK